MLQHEFFPKRRIMFRTGLLCLSPREKAMSGGRLSKFRCDVTDILKEKALQSSPSATGMMVSLTPEPKSPLRHIALRFDFLAEIKQLWT